MPRGPVGEAEHRKSKYDAVLSPGGEKKPAKKAAEKPAGRKSKYDVIRNEEVEEVTEREEDSHAECPTCGEYMAKDELRKHREDEHGEELATVADIAEDDTDSFLTMFKEFQVRGEKKI